MRGSRAPGSTVQKGGEEAGGRRPARQEGEKVGAWVERRAGEGRRPGWGEMRMPVTCGWRAMGEIASLFLNTREESLIETPC
jgi:hypothetical protein